ncbi:DUF6080 domain-containing protein [Paenibacillus marinisediminis]
MSFYNYYLRDKKDNQIAVIMWVMLFAFYVFINMPYLIYIKDQAEILGPASPFNGAPFTLNLFNFDPSMEYGKFTSSPIHPLYNFISAPLNYLSLHTVGNLLFLLLQSAMNALSTIILFLIIRRSETNRTLSILFSVWFGVSSYTLFTSLVPDSYPYAQFFIILSAAYLQKSRDTGHFSTIPGASLTLINFGITSTNLITFTGALFISLFDPNIRKETFRRFAAIMFGSLLLLIGFTVLQYVLFSGKTWLSNLMEGMSNGAFGYVAPFSFAHNSKVFHMLAVSPVLTPDVALIDPGIVAFATDLSKPYPLYVNLVGLALIGMAILGLIKGIRSRESWSWAIYILFAIVLHVGIGFGLAAYKYDMYLYAGNYLFAFFLLAAGFVRDIDKGKLKNILVIAVSFMVFITLVNNVVQHLETLDYIKSAYTQTIGPSTTK